MNTGLIALWMPIVLSAVIVFAMSSIIHMATPWHKNDFPPMPREDEVMKALGAFNIPPGDYMVPRAGSMEAMKSPEFQAKFKQGPVFTATFMPPGDMSMGKQLGMWFAYSLVVSAICAYLAHKVLPWGASYRTVFRVTSVVAFCSYSMALLQYSIWYRRNWMTTMRSVIDGLAYALLTGGTFGWLWLK